MAGNGSGGDYTLEKSLPSNVDAERMILGVILLDNVTINQAVEHLKPDDFFLPSHRRIFDKMVKLYERAEGIDPLTLQEELRKAGELDQVGGPAYIASLFDGVPRFSNIESYVKIVKGKGMLRKLIGAGNQVMQMAFDDEEEPEEILDRAERLILSIAEDRIKQGFAHIGDVAEKQLQTIEEIAAHQQLITGVATGFTDLDYMTSGLQRGDLIIVAARPSMGKTAFSLNIAQNAALGQDSSGRVHEERSKAVVGVFSLEMSKEQLVQRLMCSQAQVDAHRLRSGMLNKDDWRRLALAVGELSQADIFLDDTPGITTLEVRAKARRLKNEQKRLDLLIIDYLQLMTGKGRSESRQQEVSTISRELKILAKELDVPLIALSQLSRAPETRTGNHKPQLSDLRESGCLTGESLVTLANSGERVQIRDLVGRSNFPVLALNEVTMKLEPANVSRAFSTGQKQVFRLTTRLGRQIRATANHQFRTFLGWKRLDELSVGERLALPRMLPSNIKQEMTNADTNPDVIPQEIWRQMVVPAMQTAGISTRQMMAGIQTAYCGTKIYQQNVSRARASRIAQVVQLESLATLAQSDVYWDQIVSIEADGIGDVYDLTVNQHHNFIANDIIVHNSIEQDADVVMFIYREEVYKPETEKQNIAEIIIGKQRNGPIGSVELVFRKALTRFHDLSREAME